MKKQRIFTSAFKAKVALELIKGVKSMSKISSEYEVHQTQLSKWKSTLINNASQIFERNDISQIQKIKEEFEQEKLKYHETIGKMAMQIEFLKKKSDELSSL